MSRAESRSPTSVVQRRSVVVLFAVLAATTAAYSNSLEGDFVLDARALILRNPSVQALTWENLRDLFMQDYWQPFGAGGLYRPATTLSYLFNFAVLGNGEQPFGYHVLNLAVHLACTSLVYTLALLVIRQVRTALVAAALFGLHPIATEAVTYIAGRADLLAALGTLLALVLHASGATGLAGLLAIAVAAALGFFAKESALVLPALMLAHDALVGPRLGGRTRYAIVLLMLAFYAVARLGLARAGLPAAVTLPLDNPLVALGPLAARLTALVVAGRQLTLLAWPAELSADYSCCEIPVLSWPPSAGDGVRLGLVLAGGIVLVAGISRGRQNHPGRSFFAVWAIVTWLPSSNLIVPIGTIFAERNLYLPLAGVAVVVADLFAALRVRLGPPGRRVVTAALVAAIVACGIRTWVRNADWESDRRLWASAQRAAPGSAKAHAGLAAALFSEGGADIDAIVALGERAIEIYPDYQGALVALGGHYVVKGDRLASRGAPAEASQAYSRAVVFLERARVLDEGEHARRLRASARDYAGIPPELRGDANLFNNLSLAYLRTGRVVEALAAYERSRDLDPLRARRHADVAVVLHQLGRWEEAVLELSVAAILAPEDAELGQWLVELYRQRGGPEPTAVVTTGAVARLNLDHPDVRRHQCTALVRSAALLAAAGRDSEAEALRARRRSFCPT